MLREKINQEMKEALKAKDSVRLSVIRMLLASIKQVEVDERINPDDARIINLTVRMIKQRQDSAKIYSAAGRNDLAEKELYEVEVLKTYLPQALTEDEIELAVKQAIEKTNAKGMADMGKVIGVLKADLSGRADMAQVSQLVKNLLK